MMDCKQAMNITQVAICKQQNVWLQYIFSITTKESHYSKALRFYFSDEEVESLEDFLVNDSDKKCNVAVYPYQRHAIESSCKKMTMMIMKVTTRKLTPKQREMLKNRLPPGLA